MVPVCPHCKATRFEISEVEPKDAQYKVILVHCLGCGAPAGAMEYYSAGALLQQQKVALAKIETAVASFDTRLRKIEQALKVR